MRDTLVGAGSLVRLGLRRDRWLLPSWIAAFVLMAGTAASAGVGLFPTEETRLAAATTLNSTASMVAMFGRIYDPTSLPAISLIKYTAFMAAAIAAVMVVMTIRHSRAEEESGRLELVSGGRVGRNAPLLAALTISLGASLAIGVLSAAALVAGGFPLGGSVCFGFGWATVGMAFSAVAAVAAQVTTTSRAATGLGMVAVATAYMLRAAGDLADPGPSAWSWISPIGWNQQIRAFQGDRWWVLGLPLALCLVLTSLAFVLRGRRDLGGGIRAERSGRARGRMMGVWDLAVRIHGRVLAAWGLGFMVFGLLIGSLVNSVTGFLASPGIQDLIRKLGGAEALTDAFLGAEISIMGILAAAYGVSAVGRARTEEAAGHLEALLGTATTRTRWLTSHLTAAFGGVVVLTAITGLSIGIGAAVAQHDSSSVWRITLAALGQAPAAFVPAGMAVVLFGLAPRWSGATWGALFAFMALGEFGVVWGAPKWLMDVSPFHHSPSIPVGVNDIPALVALTGIAAVLTTVGYVGWRRRDLAG